MPRTARKKSDTSIYHVMMRGVNKQTIFEGDHDNERFIDTLARYRKETGCILYAYCLMGNHFHLLIKEGSEMIGNTIRRIVTSYVFWYNWQYSRKGHLFQDRYKSEPVEDDSYFLTALRYIHQNPLKAGLVENIDAYKWSSYREYLGQPFLVDVDYVFSLFAQDKKRALELFDQFNRLSNNDQCLDMNEENKTLSDGEIRQLVHDRFDVDLTTLKNEQIETQRKILKYMKELEGSSYRQLSRLSGFSTSKIYRT